jgi:hypothetical protein
MMIPDNGQADINLGRAFDHSRRLNSDLGMPSFARILPPEAHATEAARYARQTLLARGVAEGEEHDAQARRMVSGIMAARTTEDMLRAASSMRRSSMEHARGLSDSYAHRHAHGDFERYAASAAFANPEPDAASRLAAHIDTPVGQRDALWHNINDALLRGDI